MKRICIIGGSGTGKTKNKRLFAQEHGFIRASGTRRV